MSEHFTVTFDGHDITKYMRIISIDRGINLGRNSRTNIRNGKKGVTFLGTGSFLHTMPMSFRLEDELIEKRKKIAEILNVNEPKALIFSDEPHKIYYAFPNGDINIAEKNFLGYGTIIWEIPDGVAYSLQEYQFTNQSGNELYDYITVQNIGTEDMDLDFNADFFSDNGFVGIERDTDGSRALFGVMEEVDGIAYESSDLLFNDHLFTNRGWSSNNGVIPPVASNMKQQGSVSYFQESSGEGFARPLDYGTPGTTWTGPSLTKEVPADLNGDYAENWTSHFRVDFNTDSGSGSTVNKARQIGHQSITFIDQNDEIIISVVIEDNTTVTERSDLAVYIRNKRVFDNRNTTDYYVTARPQESNHIMVEKIGNKVNIELAFAGKRMSFDYPYTGAQLRKITWYGARFSDLPPIQNNLIRALNVVKHNVDKWQDIPNKFRDGDVLRYGKNGKNVYCLLNDMNELRMRDVGSTLISAPPGLSRFFIMYSSFSDTPKVTLKGRVKYT